MRHLFVSTIAVLVPLAGPVVPALSSPLVPQIGLADVSFPPNELRLGGEVGRQYVSLAPDSQDGDIPDEAAPHTKLDVCETIESSARENRLPVSFFTGLIWQESRFNPNSVSRAGARGIAQFMPRVAQEVGLKNPFDPREALPAAARLLRSLFDRFGNVGLAAAAYNAGPKRVLDWLEGKRSKLPNETQHYVQTITGQPAESWKEANAATLKNSKTIDCSDPAIMAEAKETERSENASLTRRHEHSARAEHRHGHSQEHSQEHRRLAKAKPHHSGHHVARG